MAASFPIGSLLTVGLPGPTLDGRTRDSLLALEPGGVILFRRNVGAHPEDLAALVAELHALPSAPLVSIDHEGGRVMRVGEPFTHFPAAAHIGRTGDPALAEAVGLAMARELRSVGIDLSYAPVLDVHSNPDNPVIGDRSFGADPAQVAAMALAQMRGLLAGGVLPCGKHFPGHGDTRVDSHFELPVVERARAEMEGVEFVPFRAAIAAGIPMLLTAHVIYTALDPENPGTLSRRINTTLLRDELGFTGVLASDDMEMKAITLHQTIGEAAVAAVRSGVDMLLVCLDLDRGVEASEALRRALEDGRLPLDRVREAAGRVSSLRALRPAPGARAEEIALGLPSEEHRRLAERLRRA